MNISGLATSASLGASTGLATSATAVDHTTGLWDVYAPPISSYVEGARADIDLLHETIRLNGVAAGHETTIRSIEEKVDDLDARICHLEYLLGEMHDLLGDILDDINSESADSFRKRLEDLLFAC